MIHLLAQAADAATGSDWPTIIASIFAGLTSLLVTVIPLVLRAKAQAQRERDAVIEGVERIPDPGARAAAKLSVKKTSFERGVAAPVDEAVKRQTGRTGRPQESE